MTTLYTDYTEAYRLNQFSINNVAFIAKLVIDTYVPTPSHTRNDVRDYTMVSAGALNGDVMTTKSMSEIMDIMKAKIREEIQTNPNDVTELLPDLYPGDPDKIQRITEILFTPPPLTEDLHDDFWTKLKEEGVKYFVVEYPILNILCFCEEIDTI